MATAALAVGWGHALFAAKAPSRLLEIEDDPSRHIELRWQGTIRAEAGRPGSWIEGFLEERFNVTFRPTFIVYFSYPRLLPIRLLTGDVPDVTWIYGRDTPRFAHHGFAMELPYEVIRKHAPNYLRLLNEHAPNNWLLTYAKGRNYGLPLFTTEGQQPWTGYWRMDWLRNVGLDRVPETLEEMEEALRRFRYNDPNRSGVQDTYGMGPSRPPSPPQVMDHTFDEIFSAHGVIATGWMVHDGKVAWGGTLPGTREALALLRRWYADGLIYPDYMTMPPGSIDRNKMFTSGLVGCLFGLGTYNSFNRDSMPSLINVMAAMHPGAEVVPSIFPRGPRGHAGSRVSGEYLAALMFGAHLADKPEKVVRVLRMMDAMAVDEELFLKARLGQRGLHWEWDPDKGLYSIPPYNTPYHASRQLIFWLPEPWHAWGYYAPFGASQKLSDRFRTQAHRDFNAEFRSEKYLMEDVLLHATIVPSADKLLADLVQMQVKMFTEIIIGRRPLGDFEVYRRQWYQGGGDVLTAEANAIYLRKAEILAAVGVAPSGREQGNPDRDTGKEAQP